jgi:hypothetical protein
MVFSRQAGPLKIATFNINNINKRVHNLMAWLAREQPDVVCLQELKVEQRAFPASALRDLGYRGVWLGERSWNGVAILAREFDPVLTRSSLPGDLNDKWCAGHFHLSAERKSSTRSEVRFQIGLVRTSNRARRGTHQGRRACRLGRRLQRRADCAGHLSDAISRQQRIDPTSESARLRSAVSPGLDGRSAKTPARGAALDVLGLRA